MPRRGRGVGQRLHLASSLSGAGASDQWTASPVRDGFVLPDVFNVQFSTPSPQRPFALGQARSRFSLDRTVDVPSKRAHLTSRATPLTATA